MTNQTPLPQQPVYAQPVVAVKNRYATASLILAICGFFLMGIPFFVGWVLGGIPDILAVIFGVVALNRPVPFNLVGRGAARERHSPSRASSSRHSFLPATRSSPFAKLPIRAHVTNRVPRSQPGRASRSLVGVYS